MTEDEKPFITVTGLDGLEKTIESYKLTKEDLKALRNPPIVTQTRQEMIAEWLAKPEEVNEKELTYEQITEIYSQIRKSTKGD